MGGRLNTLVLLAIQPHDDSLLLSTIIIIVATATPYSKLTQLDRIMGSRKDKRTGAKKRKWRKNRDDKKEASSASGSDSSSSGSSSSKEDDTSESPEKKKTKTDDNKSKTHLGHYQVLAASSTRRQ